MVPRNQMPRQKSLHLVGVCLNRIGTDYSYKRHNPDRLISIRLLAKIYQDERQINIKTAKLFIIINAAASSQYVNLDLRMSSLLYNAIAAAIIAEKPDNSAIVRINPHRHWRAAKIVSMAHFRAKRLKTKWLE